MKTFVYKQSYCIFFSRSSEFSPLLLRQKIKREELDSWELASGNYFTVVCGDESKVSDNVWGMQLVLIKRLRKIKL